MMRIRYEANNSGGRWWLSDTDWIELEQAGWEVQWGGMYICGDSYWAAPKGAPEPCLSNRTGKISGRDGA